MLKFYKVICLCVVAICIKAGTDHTDNEEQANSISYMTDGAQKDEFGIFEGTEPNWLHLQKSFPVRLVNFHIPWCKHCKQFGPVFDNLARPAEKMVPGIAVIKVDIAHWKSLRKRYNIERVPAVMLFWTKSDDESNANYTYQGLGQAEAREVLNFVASTLRDEEQMVVNEQILETLSFEDDFERDRFVLMLLLILAMLLFSSVVFYCFCCRRTHKMAMDLKKQQ